jgi:hypothetical protein
VTSVAILKSQIGRERAAKTWARVQAHLPEPFEVCETLGPGHATTLARNALAEILIDRQGYIRAIWRGDGGGMPRASQVQALVETLNEEKSPPPFPADHVH